MLQALIHKKLKNSFADPEFRPSEDALTSSTIGVLQFLPDEMFWNLLRQACCEPQYVPKDVGTIISINFWEKWTADGIVNKNFVEPDVWIESENYHIIIEAKKYDGVGQYQTQWKKEIMALLSEGIAEKEIIFIALGGNAIVVDECINVDKAEFRIHKATWFNLLHAVNLQINITDTGSQRRILQTVVNAFEQHRMVDVLWLNSMRRNTLKSIATSLPWKKGCLKTIYSPQLKMYREWNLSKN